MSKLTKNELERALTEQLGLKDPKYKLEKVSGRFVGHIISPSFRGKRDHERQDMIWDALEAKYGRDSVKAVGMLLAYTPEEWDFGSEQAPKKKTRKAG